MRRTFLSNKPIGRTLGPQNFNVDNLPSWKWDTEHPDSFANCLFLAHLEDNAANTTVTDSSGNSYNGTADANTDTFSTASGKFNRGFNLNMTNDFKIDNNTLDAAITTAMAGALTFECWAKNDSADWSVQGVQRLVTIIVDGSNEISLYYSSGDDTLYYTVNAGGTTKSVTLASSSPIDTTTWHHYALVWDKTGDTLKGFVDGAAVGSTQTGLGTWGAGLMTIEVGSYNGTIQIWDGQIDEVAISNTARYS